jgi:YggT family protein
MLNQALAFTVGALFDIFILAALVRFWMQVFKAPYRNPVAQLAMALTDFAVKPLRRFVPGLFGLDFASFLFAWAAEFVLQAILLTILGASFVSHPEMLTVVLFLALVQLLRLTVYIVMGAVFVQALLSWVNPYHPVAPFFDAFTRPFLKPFRKAVPLVGGVDITPILVLIAAQLVLLLPVAWLEGQCGRLLAAALVG